jgi:phosphomannomutase / phosphoglucomutase
MTAVDRAVFREYDIRGVAERDLPDALVEDLGRAIAGMLGAPRPDARPRLAVGRDCRLTSPRLFAALVAGATRAGADVLDLGVVPTPVLYFAAFELPIDGAVIITGSHNPAPDNGFKILRGKDALHGPAIQALAEAIERGDLPDAGPAGRGTVEQRDVVPAYLDHAASQLQLGGRRPRVVLDAGNAAGGPTAVALYRRLGFDVVPLHCEMDGRFPNHHPDPTVEANLADLVATVAREGADLGLALDGDADRIGAVDRHGRVLWGDQLMILFGQAILREQPGATFIAEVKCSQALFDELGKAGGQVIMGKVGHSLIKARIKETGAALGGEMSGHMFFAHRYLGFDDGIYAGARLLELLSHDERDLAALRDSLPQLINTPEIRVDCPDAIKFAVVAETTDRLRRLPEVRAVIDVDGVRADFGDGWGLVRASNTQPALVLRCEAATAERLSAIRAILDAELGAARAHLEARK